MVTRDSAEHKVPHRTLILERSTEDVEREIRARLAWFEERYGISSEEMARRQEADEEPETREIAQWLFWYRALANQQGG